MTKNQLGMITMNYNKIISIYNLISENQSNFRKISFYSISRMIQHNSRGKKNKNKQIPLGSTKATQ